MESSRLGEIPVEGDDEVTGPLPEMMFAEGFALALQLVIVEAVPALTEVVQEACSSSESDSDDENADRHASQTKKQTLCPSHAREVDRKAEVGNLLFLSAKVTSIIPADPRTPVNDSLVNWSDDVVDAKVENLVRIISKNQLIRKEMFRGGVSKVDVERMRANVKDGGKRKPQNQKHKDVAVHRPEEAKMKSLINSVLRPEIDRIDATIAAAVASVKEISSSGFAYQSSVVATVEAMLRNFKTEILACFPKEFRKAPVEGVHPTAVGLEGASGEVPTNRSPPAANGVGRRDVRQYSTPAMLGSNEDIVDDVMGNLSHYSTPPASRKRWQGSEAESRRQERQKFVGGEAPENMRLNVSRSLQSEKPTSARRLSLHVSDVKLFTVIGLVSLSALEPRKSGSVACGVREQVHQASLSAQSQTHDSGRQNAAHLPREPEIPSFSLGLTQELRTVVQSDIVELGEKNKSKKAEDDIEAEVGDNEDSFICRKSKRLRHIPPQLINDYHCGAVILNRAREEQHFVNSPSDYSEICEKYTRLKMLLKKDCVFNVGGLSVTGKDLIDIGERKRFLPGRVLDILTRLVASTFKKEALGGGDTAPVFLDSRLQCLLSRNYPRFKKTKSKEGYVFSNAMVDLVSKSYSREIEVGRFYIPFNVDRKHWVGLCVDIRSSKIFVFDSNMDVIMDDALVNGNEMVVERMKGLSQNTNPADSALTACLFMQTHALFGFDVCRSLTPTVIPAEARKAAILIYEFHKKL
ncbi:hypothetical protein HID58_033948 [Brassica napus]|uniref:Ubiquitin-like protease family profile domain-containing protein n=1 Tax=Brassica napus TaxID=3708 RepID=A0ABQ8C1M8_BRANA|nr:hypothetical protein HID58_033948 [Brassica napus]